MYIAEMGKYDYQRWVRRVPWFTGNSRYWETTGPGTPGPYRGDYAEKVACGAVS